MNDFNDFDDEFEDDFNDDFGDDGPDFMNDDSIEDAFEDDFGPENLVSDDNGIEDDQIRDDECEDELTANEALLFGVAMGFAFEEGLEEGKRRKLEQEIDKENEDKFLDDEETI